MDYVYDSDPKKNINAKKITEIGWQDYRKLIPETWNPGLSSPFDPIASQKAQELGLEVIVMNGRPIDNLTNFLNNKNFKGTVIK
jgi:uridylate kinase